MQTDGYVEASWHYFTLSILNTLNCTVSMIQKTKRKGLHTVGVSTFILSVSMCLRSLVHNKAQGQLYIPGTFICGLCSEMVLP
jgi:hypothetical protein